MVAMATPTMTYTERVPVELKTLNLQGDRPLTVDAGKSLLDGPLKYNGSFDKFPHFEITPSIGREFKGELQLSALLDGPDVDTLMKELGVLVSRRGVCVFRGQDITGEQMMLLAEKIGRATGKPSSSGHCIHPVSDYTPELVNTPKTQTISADIQRKAGGINRRFEDVSRWASVAWHSDVSFENCPADYSLLKINLLPESGGDTQFINTYDVIEKMSPSFREYLETLTAEHNAEFFHAEAEKLGLKVRDDLERGNPLNKGSRLVAHHPIIRTNPVTGWKALFVNRGFTKRIDGVSKDESDMILHYLNEICIHSFDSQVRLRWEAGTVALWDNRSTWHSATFDYEEERRGDRASSIGERPYLDTRTSILRSEGLRAEGKKW